MLISQEKLAYYKLQWAYVGTHMPQSVKDNPYEESRAYCIKTREGF